MRSYLTKTTDAAPLVVYRILFGVMMLFSIVRFWANGWIEKLYLAPTFHFHYLGLEWVTVLGVWTYVLFVLCGLSAIGIMLGYKYRLSATLFFLSFTYIELMDKATYLNHYYFISVMSFILIWLPANVSFSLDARTDTSLQTTTIPRWTIDSLKLVLTIVYFYAGIAKLHTDWMISALPLAIWLPAKTHIPLIGGLMDKTWVHYAFSWGGAVYDICVAFLLMWRPTRLLAFVAVVVFHVLTRILFPIGMFPFIMIVSTLIFFDAGLHNRVLDALHNAFKWKPFAYSDKPKYVNTYAIVGLVLLLQILIPLRCLVYPGNVFWTEEGYRFAWRVMLMEKTGYVQLTVKDTISGKQFAVQNDDFLTSFQEKQMSTQSDFIIEYAHYLATHFKQQGHQNLAIYAESYVSLNGRPTQRYIKPDVNLLDVHNTLRHKPILMPFDE